MKIIAHGIGFAALALAALLAPSTVSAEEIVVSNYGVAANGMPYAIAMEKGFFKAEGADVTGILSSSGGGTTVRNLLDRQSRLRRDRSRRHGGGDPAGRRSQDRQRQRADRRRVRLGGKAGFADQVVSRPQGKKIGYTNPRSTSQALDILLLEQAGLKPDEAELVKTGGFGKSVVALNLGSIDAAAMADPVWSKNRAQFRVLASANDVMPPLCNVIGVTTGKAAAERGDFVRAILRGRRKAVEFMYSHTDEAIAIVAKAYNLDPAVAASAIHNLVAKSKSGVPYWGPGNFDFDGMNAMLRAQKLVGALSGDVDWSKVVDTSFLADDLKPKK